MIWSRRSRTGPVQVPFVTGPSKNEVRIKKYYINHIVILFIFLNFLYFFLWSRRSRKFFDFFEISDFRVRHLTELAIKIFEISIFYGTYGTYGTSWNRPPRKAFLVPRLTGPSQIYGT